MFKKSFNAQQLGLLILEVLLRKLELPNASLRCGVSDGCPTNQAAFDTIRNLFRKMITPTCISHAANVIGKILIEGLPIAKSFESSWSLMMSSSPHARLLFRSHSGETAKRQSETRWYAWWEIMNQIYCHSATVQRVLDAFNIYCDRFNSSRLP